MEINLTFEEKIKLYGLSINTFMYLNRVKYTVRLNVLHLKTKLVGEQAMIHACTSYSLDEAIDDVIKAYITDDLEHGGNSPDLIREPFKQMYVNRLANNNVRVFTND